MRDDGRWERWVAGLAVAMTMLGCGQGAAAAVRSRAAIEFTCPETGIRVERLPAGAFMASGCGRRVSYVCLGNGFGLTCAADREDADRAGSVAPPALPPSWSDDAVRGLLLATNGDVLACLGPDHPPFDVRVQISERGQITHSGVLDGAATPDQQRCVTAVFVRASVEGRAARPRTAVLHFAPAAAAATAGGEAPPAGSTTSSATSYIASHLDAHRDEILACVGAERIGVAVSWDALGAVTLSLRGAHAGGVEEACLRAAVGTLVIEPSPDSPGSMVHPVTD